MAAEDDVNPGGGGAADPAPAPTDADAISAVHSKLLDCAKRGELEAVNSAIDEAGDRLQLGWRNAEGLTATLAAASLGRVVMVRHLLNAGADPDEVDAEQLSGLYYAATNDVPQLVDVYADAGADMDPVDKDQQTPMHMAAKKGYASVVSSLVKANASTSMVERWDSRTALHLAASAGHDDVCEVLLQAGANGNAKDRSEDTPLHLAAKNSHLTTIRVLCKAGVDTEVRNGLGLTPLLMAVSLRLKEIIAVTLCECGADTSASLDKVDKEPRMAGKSGVNVVHFAARDLLAEALKAITAHASTEALNAVDSDGCTPLHHACLSSERFNEDEATETIEELLKAKVEVNTENRWGITPLHWLALRGLADAAGMLIDAGANVDAHNTPDGDTPLHWAAATGRVKIARLYTRAGLSTKALLHRNRYGRTPLDNAKMFGSASSKCTMHLAEATAAALRARGEEPASTDGAPASADGDGSGSGSGAGGGAATEAGDSGPKE